MNAHAPQMRKLIATLGVLLMIGGLGLAVGKIQTTEASWADQVYGKSEISVGRPYARAISSYGTMFPYLSGKKDLGPNEAAAGTANSGSPFDQRINGTDFTGLAGFLPMEAYNRSCARAGGSARECELPGPRDSTATAYAVAETGQLKMWVGSFGNNRLITIGHALNLNSARTTAECRLGTEGVPGLNSAAEVILGGNFSDNIGNFYEGRGTRIPMPTAGKSNSGVWLDGVYRYDGTISHTFTKGENHASSQLRLHVRSTLATWPYSHFWTMDIVLAHAECGTALRVPSRPDRPAREGQWPVSSRARMAQALENPTEEEEQSALAESADEDGVLDAEAPDDADEDSKAGAAANPSVTTASSASASAPTPPAAPTEAVALEPTEQTAVATGPQEPETVRVGREFAIVNRDGVELGAAKVEDIVRTPGCGVELTLSISTSADAGPDRWASIEPSDFAEVRPGGSIRKAKRMSSDCEQSANSRTTALSPGREYEIVIAFALDDSAQRAMLRPHGTAGWVFDLPPLPRASTTKPTPTTSPQAVAPTSSPSASTSAVAEETAAATAEA